MSNYPFDTFPLTKRVGIVNPVANLDARYGPWPTFNDALTGFSSAVRERGLTVAVSGIDGIVEYWYKNGITNSDLVLKSSDITEADILPTVTNYLSTNSVLISGLTVISNISTQNYDTAKDWSYKQNFIGTVALTSTNFLELLANRNYIQYELSANLAGFSNPHGSVIVNNKIYLSSHFGSGNDGRLVVINDPLNDLTNQTLISLPNETSIPDICYHKQTDRIYGVVSASNGVDKIIRFNPNNNTYDTFYLLGNEANSNSCITNDDEYLYVSVFPKIYRIRISDATLANTYQSGFDLQTPHTIKISPDGKYILTCSSPSGGAFFRINIQTGVINQISFGYPFTDDSVVLGDYFYTATEGPEGFLYQINWKTLAVRRFNSFPDARPSWCVSTDGRFVYFIENYTTVFTDPNNAFIHKYDPDNDSWHTIYTATTIPLLNVANRFNELLFIGDTAFITNYDTGADKIYKAKIKTEVTTVPVLRDDRINWDINSPAVYNLQVNNVSATGSFFGRAQDNQLSLTSSNTVQNSAVTVRVNTIEQRLTTLLSISANFPTAVLQLQNNPLPATTHTINASQFGTVYQAVSADQTYVIQINPGSSITLFISGNHDSIKRHNVTFVGPTVYQFYITGAGQSNNFYTFKNHITKVTLTNPLSSTLPTPRLMGIGTAEIIRTDLDQNQGGLGFINLETTTGPTDFLLQENGDRLVIRNFV